MVLPLHNVKNRIIGTKWRKKIRFLNVLYPCKMGQHVVIIEKIMLVLLKKKKKKTFSDFNDTENPSWHLSYVIILAVDP